MTTIAIKEYYCSFCESVSRVLKSTWNGFIKFSETAGRARAARELTRMGLHKEAKALMLGKDII